MQFSAFIIKFSCKNVKGFIFNRIKLFLKVSKTFVHHTPKHTIIFYLINLIQ